MQLRGCHHPPGGLVGPSWLNLALLEERQLVPEEEVLRSQGAARAPREDSQSDEVEHDQRQYPIAVHNGA
jgi:hypothetical protein